MVSYRLIRRLPDGTVRGWPRTFPTRRDVARAVAYCLEDNGAASRRDAAAFASTVEDAPLGGELAHVSGYAFTVKADTRKILP